MVSNSKRDRSTKFESIQVLRFAAAFLVVAFHWSQLQFDLMNPPFRIGAAGVDIFFVISGFIIGHSSRGFGGREFLRRRIIRIVPLYWVLTIALFLVASAMPSLLRSPPSSLVELFKSLFFVPYARADGTVQPVLFLGWTLNYEMFFYVSMAFAIFVKPYTTLVLSSFFIALVTLGYATTPSEPLLAFYTSGIVLEFLFGLWIYEAYARWPQAFARLGVVALIGWSALLVQNFIEVPHRELFKGIPAVLILIGTVSLPISNGGLMRGVVALGDASYSMYLIHPYIIQAVLKILHPSSAISIFLVGIAIFSIVFLVSILGFRILEKPTGMFLNRLFSGPTRLQPVQN